MLRYLRSGPRAAVDVVDALGEVAEATENFVDAPYRFEVLEGVSHWIPELASEDVNRLLIEHLAQP